MKSSWLLHQYYVPKTIAFRLESHLHIHTVCCIATSSKPSNLALLSSSTYSSSAIHTCITLSHSHWHSLNKPNQAVSAVYNPNCSLSNSANHNSSNSSPYHNPSEQSTLSWKIFCKADLPSLSKKHINQLLVTISKHPSIPIATSRMLQAIKLLASNGIPIPQYYLTTLFLNIRSMHTKDLFITLQYLDMLKLLYTQYSHLCNIQLTQRDLNVLTLIGKDSQDERIIAAVQSIGLSIGSEPLFSKKIMDLVLRHITVKDLAGARKILDNAGPSQDPNILSTTALFLARSGDSISADLLVRQCVDSNVKLQDIVFIHVFVGHLESKNYELARLWMTWIPTVHQNVFVDVWSLWIRKMFQISINHFQDILVQVDLLLQDPEFKPHDKFLFNVVFGLMSVGDITSAFKYFDTIRLKGDFVPSTDSRSVIQACLILSDTLSDQLHSTEELIRFSTDRNNFKCTSILIHAFLKVHQIENALYIYDLMVKSRELGGLGYRPRADVMHMFLCYYYQRREISNAFQFYKRALADGAFPNGRVIKILLELSRNEITIIENIWQDFISKSSASSYHPLPKAFYQFTDTQLMSVAAKTSTHGDKHDDAQLTRAFSHLLLQKSAPGSNRFQEKISTPLIIKENKTSDISLGIATPNISKMSRSDDGVLNDIEWDEDSTTSTMPHFHDSNSTTTFEQPRYPDLSEQHYHQMLVAFLRHNLYAEAQALLKDMHVRIREASWFILIPLAQSKYALGDYEACLSIIEMARLSTSHRPIQLLRLELKACCAAKNTIQAETIFNEMIEMRILPFLEAFEQLATAYSFQGKALDACRLWICAKALGYRTVEIEKCIHQLWDLHGNALGGTLEEWIEVCRKDPETIALCKRCLNIMNKPKPIASSRQLAIDSLSAVQGRLKPTNR
ncbi:hypothetical protein BDV3_005035 [Batrachochytrium dendrobatidis]